MERREQGYEFFQEFEYNIPGFLSIGNFIKNNHVHTNKIADILRDAKNILGLQLQISILKHEIETLKETKIGYSSRPLQPLEPLPRYHNW